MHQQVTINARGKLIALDKPAVVGILNVSPDSFYAESRIQDVDVALRRAEEMLLHGATFLDVGAVSTRPGSIEISEEQERSRLLPVLESLVAEFPDAIISVDTTSTAVARDSLERGVHIINDISGGDQEIWNVVAGFKAPYILMHMQGTPQTMQDNPAYADVTAEVLRFFISKVREMRTFGLHDIILDPGFGFGKSVQHNYTLLKNLGVFNILGLPVMAGISRKSMICKVLKINPINALNGSTALHMIALQNGASMLRAHDVKEAVEVVRLYAEYQSAE